MKKYLPLPPHRVRGPISPTENLCGCRVQTRRGYVWWYLYDQYGLAEPSGLCDLGKHCYEYSAFGAVPFPMKRGRHARVHIGRIARLRYRLEDGSYSETMEVREV